MSSLLACYSQATSRWQPYLTVGSLSYSEPVSVNSAIKDLSGKFTPGDTAFTRNRLELGLQKGNWQFALLDRYDYHVKFHPDTAQLMYRKKNHLTLNLKRSYMVDIKANHLHAKGIKAAYYFRPTERLILKITGNLLYGSALLNGDIKGSLAVQTDDSFLLQTTIDYNYSDDVLLNREVEDPSGIGLSIDLALDWQASDKMVLSASFEDLANRIFWNSAPYTLAKGTSATNHFDENGLLAVQPLLSGVESQRSHAQRLPVQTILTGYYKITPTTELVVDAIHVMATTLPAIGYRLQLEDQSFFSLKYGLKNKALSLAYERENLSIKLENDALSFTEAHTIGLTLSYQLPLD